MSIKHFTLMIDNLKVYTITLYCNFKEWEHLVLQNINLNFFFLCNLK